MLLASAPIAMAADPAQDATDKIPRKEPTPALNEAARFGFVESMFHSFVAEKCEKLPEPTRSQMKQARAGWRERNQYLINPLWFWSNYRVALTGARGSVGQEALLAILQPYEDEAKGRMKAELPGRKPSVEACNAQIARFADPALDLKVSAHAPALQEIREYSYLYAKPVSAEFAPPVGAN